MSPYLHPWRRSPSALLSRLAFGVASIYYLCTEATIAVCILIIGADSLVIMSVRFQDNFMIIRIYHSVDKALLQTIEWIPQGVSAIRRRLLLRWVAEATPPLEQYDVTE